MSSLLKEAIVVGVVTSIFGFIISTGLMFTKKDFTLKKYDFWPSVLLSYFITGFFLHLIFEMTGGNKWYCKNGNACKI